MARQPNKILFTCELCHAHAQPRQVRNWQGRCHKCKREGTWSVTVFYIDTEAERSVLGTLSKFIFGLGWFRIVSYTNTLTATSIPTDVARYLTETQAVVKDRVSNFVRLRQNQELQKKGALSCLHCEATFVPSNHPWHNAGYCSRLCATHAGGGETNPAPESGSSGSAAGMVAVICPNGHRFEVHNTFCGCARPCPACKSKTLVPPR